MGEVYRASDTRLGRDVALKLLPPDLAVDPDRLARFEREAKLLASLNHPNVAHVYGFESEALPDGTTARFLAMELVEGADLAARLKRGPIPMAEALEIAKQIAEALEEAHEKGIVHRDLKPANVKVTPEGKVKVLDFGLAKAYAGESMAGPGPDLSQSPTLAHTGTAAGLILGTAAYMSPEQARGKPVDRRTDIWALGVVLFEMLSGRPVFAGETVSDVLASVLAREPDWTTLPEEAAPVRSLLERCLQRDPRRRIRDAGDLRLELERVATSPPAPPDARKGSRRAPSRLAWTATTLAAAVVGAAAAWLAVSRPPAPRGPLRLSIQLSPRQRLALSDNALVTFAPDGRSLTFAASEDGRTGLFRRRLGEEPVVRVEGTDGGSAAFFSPDGRWLGFIGGGQYRRVPAEGGRPLDLAGSQGAGGAVWLPGGDVVFAPMYSDGLFRVPAEGGASTRLTTPDRKAGELGHWWPSLLPDGDTILFTGFRTPVDTSRIRALSLSTGRVHDVVDGGFFGRYVPGFLLYAKGGRMYAAPFDPKHATATGPGRPVLEDLYTSSTSAYAAFDVSAEGTLAYIPASVADASRELVWVDRDGRVEPVTGESRRFVDLALSPDGRNVAVTILGDSLDLWTLDVRRGTLSRLTTSPGTEFCPVWAREGSEILFVVDRPPFEIHRIPFGSAAPEEPLWKEPAREDTVVYAVSPDGRFVGYQVTEPVTGKNLWVRQADGRAPARPFRATRAVEQFLTFSPDGRWAAYESDETGRPEVYVEAFPGPGERRQVTADGGAEPVWARNGDLFYRHDADVRVVGTRTEKGLEFAPPTTMFSMPPYRSSDNGRTYDVTADGRRVIVIRTPEATAPRRIEIVTDWLAELPRLFAGN
jgi:serine/threonine protein kinase/Tol biopolymer transport system component